MRTGIGSNIDTYITGNEIKLRTAVAIDMAANVKYTPTELVVNHMRCALSPRTMMENRVTVPKSAYQ